MKRIMETIANHEIADTRAAFYYLSRYLKQADHFEKYKKDFFEDDYQSAPSENTKSLTIRLIEIIESETGKSASEFSDADYIYWMETIDFIETNLDPEPSEHVKKSAKSAIEGFSSPKVGKC